jgi:hypothetical protein
MQLVENISVHTLDCIGLREGILENVEGNVKTKEVTESLWKFHRYFSRMILQ